MILLAGLPYFGYDNVWDERAVLLSQIGVDQADAVEIAKVVCEQLTLPDVTVSIDSLGPEYLAKGLFEVETVDSIVFDDETVEAIVDATDDARYEEAQAWNGPRIVFDGPLTYDGLCIPVQLVVHELAHHVEWHRLGGRVEGHLKVFGDAFRVVTEAVWQLLHLDRWTEERWLEVAPQVLEPTIDDASIYRLRHEVHGSKWQLLLSAPWN